MNGAAAALARESLVAARAAVEPAAFVDLYDRYYPRVHNYVRYRVNDTMVADDLVAQVFEKALTHIHSYDPDRGPFAVWLMAIARNSVNDHLRALQRRHWLPLDLKSWWPSSDPTPEEVVLEDERNAELLAAIAKRGDRDRDLLAQKFALGLTNRRIAELTGLTPSNVGVILFRAVRRLRRLLPAAQGVGDGG